MSWREKLFNIIEPRQHNTRASMAYDYVMIVVIVASLVPLAFKQSNTVFLIIEWIATVVFIIDYILRLITADIKLHYGRASFFVYPVTPMALIDLITILPGLLILDPTFRVFRIFRLVLSLRVLRVFRIIQYSRSVTLLVNVVRRQQAPLITVCTLVVAYILIVALIMFNVEPQTFDTYLDAVYWSTVSLTTIGYGDIVPASTAGQIVTMLSALVGVAIIALPASIITAGYMQEIGAEEKPDEDQEEATAQRSNANNTIQANNANTGDSDAEHECSNAGDNDIGCESDATGNSGVGCESDAKQ